MQLKVVCLNMWEGHLLREAVDFLRNQNADILLLQEVYAGTADHLKIDYRTLQTLQDELPYEYSDFSASMLDVIGEDKVEQGNAVLSKFPITNSSRRMFDLPYRERDPFDPKEFPITPRSLQHVQLDVNGREVNIFNFQGVWDLDGDSFSDERRNMSEVVLEAIAGKPRVILGGDTNAKTTNQAIKMIEAHLNNAFGDGPPTTSFNMRRKDNPGYATACVDMLFTSSDITLNNWSMPNVDVSDHFPVVVELTIETK